MSGRVFCFPPSNSILICIKLSFPQFEPILPVMTIDLPMSFFFLFFLLTHDELSHLAFSHWAAGERKCSSRCLGIWQPAKANPPLSSTHFLKLPYENQCLVAVLGLQVPDGWSCLSVALQKVFVEPSDSLGLSCWLTPVELLRS